VVADIGPLKTRLFQRLIDQAETNLPEVRVVQYNHCLLSYYLLPHYLLPPEVQVRG
jgi:hypothetical protein